MAGLLPLAGPLMPGIAMAGTWPADLAGRSM